MEFKEVPPPMGRQVPHPWSSGPSPQHRAEQSGETFSGLSLTAILRPLAKLSLAAPPDPLSPRPSSLARFPSILSLHHECQQPQLGVFLRVLRHVRMTRTVRGDPGILSAHPWQQMAVKPVSTSPGLCPLPLPDLARLVPIYVASLGLFF